MCVCVCVRVCVCCVLVSLTLVILNKGQTTICEEIELYSQEKSIYNRETVSRQEHRISEYRIRI